MRITVQFDDEAGRQTNTQVEDLLNRVAYRIGKGQTDWMRTGYAFEIVNGYGNRVATVTVE